MKRVIALLIVCVFTCMAFSACATDISTMTDAELKAQYDTIRNELASRGFKAENKTVIFDQDGYQIYISGEARIDKKYSVSSELCLYIPIVIVNNTSYNTNLSLHNCSVNGWSAEGYGIESETPAGKKSKASLRFDLVNTDLEIMEDFTDVEFVINVIEKITYKHIIESEPITIYAE